jgi:FkbM family methyltransferase
MNYFNNLFSALIESPNLHYRKSAFYEFIKDNTLDQIHKSFSSSETEFKEFGPIGKIKFPYVKMGAVDTLDLFGLDEVIIFAFYFANKDRYKNCVDIGANLGLHSIIMSKCGFKVKAYEPDPWHYEIAASNIALNSAPSIVLNQKAVSIEDGKTTFVRVLGNTTGSHLIGAKNSYGKTEEFEVEIESAKSVLLNVDFAKIDAEGHEKVILSAVTKEMMDKLDIMVEIGNPENAKSVYEHFTSLGVSMFAQKLGWRKVQSWQDVPTSHREGSLFISKKILMPWRLDG